MNKSSLTNIAALLVVVLGCFSPFYKDIIILTGVFALSGALTNWLAIHMLFEKVPFLYGSGVIPSRFEDFKTGIKNLIIEEFFSKKHIEKFFAQNNKSLSVQNINSKIDFDKVFDGLVDAIMESKMGAMLGMFGGKEALNPLKEPIIERLKSVIEELVESKDSSLDGDFTKELIDKVEDIIDDRLNELTPAMVKSIIQKMIKKHLGWLVVWGGVFGGLIGLVFTITAS